MLFDKLCQTPIIGDHSREYKMATMNISLPDLMKRWVETRTTSGRFSNASDYVRHLIRRDQEREQASKMLQQAIDEGIASGEPKPFDFDEFHARMRERHGSN